MNIYDELSDIFASIYKYAIPFVYILGNLGNLISAIIFSKTSWRKNVCVFYLKFYLLFDTFYLHTYVVSQLLLYTFDISLPDFNNALCKLYQYTFYLFVTLLHATLVLASIDRLLISSQTIDTRLYSSKRLAYFSLSISTTFWVVFYSHLLVKSSIQQITPWYSTCLFDLTKPYVTFLYYSLGITNFLGCLLMIILCLLSLKNVQKIHIFPSHQCRGTRSMTKKDFQLLRCLYVLDVILIIFTMLLTTYDTYSILTESERTTSFAQSRHAFLAELFTNLAVIPHVSSFWVFLSISKAFQNQLRRLFYKIVRKNFPIQRNEEENHQNNIDLSVVGNTTELPVS